MKRTIIFGPPGTGKTTKLMELMERAFERGYEPEEIAFVSFTKAAVTEAVVRATKRFGFPAKRLALFRTLHSLAYSAMGVQRESVVTDYSDFAADYGFSISKRVEEGVPPEAMKGDDLLLRAKGLCDATGLPAEEIQQAYALPLSLLRYETFIERLSEWKQQHGRVEFSDMIDAFVAADAPVPARVAFIDEAQDLTPVQWRMVEIAFRDVERMFIAGDDDQAIYHWVGADARRMLRMEGERHVLQQSYRVPRTVHDFAQRIIERVDERQEKEWRAREVDGAVQHGVRLGAIDLSQGSWMLLARTNMSLAAYTRELESRGIPYRYNGAPSISDAQAGAYSTLLRLRAGEAVAATDARRMLVQTDKLPGLRIAKTQVTAKDFPESALAMDSFMLSKIPGQRLRFMNRCGRALAAPIRVDVSTIHQAKGSEADSVVLSPDLTSATAKALSLPRHAPAEHRAFYVGATRTKEKLLILRPGADYAYPVSD